MDDHEHDAGIKMDTNHRILIIVMYLTAGVSWQKRKQMTLPALYVKRRVVGVQRIHENNLGIIQGKPINRR